MHRQAWLSIVLESLEWRATGWRHVLTIGRSGGVRTARAFGASRALWRVSPAAGLPVVWRSPLGRGFSGPAVAQEGLR